MTSLHPEPMEPFVEEKVASAPVNIFSAKELNDIKNQDVIKRKNERIKAHRDVIQRKINKIDEKINKEKTEIHDRIFIANLKGYNKVYINKKMSRGLKKELLSKSYQYGKEITGCLCSKKSIKRYIEWTDDIVDIIENSV